jgi:hypothetical protein
MPAAIAIPMIVGAASSVAAAKMSSNAANKAAKTQTAAADKALAANQAVYQDQRQLMAPYTQAGQSAVTTLGRLLTPGAGATYASAPLPQLGPGPFAGGNTAMPRPQMASRGGAFSAALGQGPAPRMGGQGPMPQMGAGQMPGMGAGPAPQIGAGPMPGMGQGPQGMISLRAPNGSVGQVPAHLAQQFISRGAVPVQ